MIYLIFKEFIKALWILFPAYAANGLPPFSKLIKKKHPIDFGLKIGNKRLLGDGKTWEGFGIGMIGSLVIGGIELLLWPQLNDYSLVYGGFSLAYLTPLIIFLIPLGALLGDAAGSFVKRRLNMKRGQNAPVLDQLDFILGVILFTWLFVDYSMIMIAIMLIVTFLAHRLTSIAGFKMKIKREPW